MFKVVQPQSKTGPAMLLQVSALQQVQGQALQQVSKQLAQSHLARRAMVQPIMQLHVLRLCSKLLAAAMLFRVMQASMWISQLCCIVICCLQHSEYRDSHDAAEANRGQGSLVKPTHLLC